MLTYGVIISLGEDCATRGHLNDCSLTHNSYSFDWVTGCTIQERIDQILADFSDWLNKDDLEYFQLNADDGKNHRYKNIKTGICFHHDFSKDLQFDEAYEKVSDKYQRRNNRLLESLRQSRKVLFIYISRNQDNNIDDVKKSIKKLNKKYKRTQIDLIIIDHDESLSMDQYTQTRINKNITKFRLNNTPYDFSTPFERFKRNKKMINAILSNYQLANNQENNKIKISLINKIRYKIWKHLNKKLKKKGII